MGINGTCTFSLCLKEFALHRNGYFFPLLGDNLLINLLCKVIFF